MQKLDLKPRNYLGKNFIFILCCLFLLLASCAEPGDGVALLQPVSQKIFAGSGSAGFADGQGTAARFGFPYGIATGPDGTIYVADTENGRVRKITPSGSVSTLAASGTSGLVDGQSTAVQFTGPSGIAVAPDGTIYVADLSSNRIREITPVGLVTTLAAIAGPAGITLGADGNLYVTTRGSEANRIYKITPAGVLSEFVGADAAGFADGQGATARFSGPGGIVVGPDGNIYVAEAGNNSIRRVTPAGLVSTLAGSGTEGFADGQGQAAQFNFPRGIAVGPDGNIYVADLGNNSIRRVSPSGEVSTVIKGLNRPLDIAFSAKTAYITDVHRIIRVRFR